MGAFYDKKILIKEINKNIGQPWTLEDTPAGTYDVYIASGSLSTGSQVTVAKIAEFY